MRSLQLRGACRDEGQGHSTGGPAGVKLATDTSEVWQ
jgi:hypothetical protein